MAINELRAINEQYIQLEVFLHPTMEYLSKLNSEQVNEYFKKIAKSKNIEEHNYGKVKELIDALSIEEVIFCYAIFGKTLRRYLIGRMVSKYDPAFLMTMLDAIASHHDNTYLCFNFLRLNGKLNQEELKDLVVKALAGHGDDLRLQREALSAAEQNKIIEAIPNIVSNFIQRETKISDEAREVVAYLEKFV